ncbi:YJL193W [Saccharomyces arboricola H-6]|uniref:YJL193W n=1 Tax=Saccharomyces arboricola (strain H-6 / AS 2.3317 / CBS 10644) TaxID=1160507 RepID=J8LMA2_SACAR|nr:YJL193W [Saccharomyces arboricola H-6]
MFQRLSVSIKHNAHIILLCISWYFISSLASQVTKQVLTACPLPLFLGEFQFIYTAALAWCSCFIAYNFPRFYRIFPKGTFPEYYSNNGDTNSMVRKPSKISALIISPSRPIVLTVLPLGLFQFVGKYFGHTATSLVPVSTVASIKTLSPMFILLLQKILKISTLKVTLTLVFSLCTLALGVWIIVQQDNRLPASSNDLREFSKYGIICAIISMFIFVLQNIYGKKVFTFRSQTDGTKSHSGSSRQESPLPMYEKSNEKLITNNKPKSYDKLTLMIYISLVGFCLSFFWFIVLEFPVLYKYFSQINDSPTIIHSFPVYLFLLNGTFHFMQAMITFHLLGEVSTLTYSIANLMKRFAIIAVSWVFIGRRITWLQVFGLILNTLGLFLYERCTSQSKIKLKLRPE